MIVGLVNVTAMLKTCVLVPAGLEADRKNVLVPVPVAVPLTTPVLASRLRPAGRAPAVIS